MPKNLTDYSPDKHEQMAGMWCYIFDYETEPDTPIGEGIIAGYRKANDGRTVVIIDNPHPDGEKRAYELHNIVPRFDLLRAWNPDGTHVKGRWTTAEHIKDRYYYLYGIPTHRYFSTEWESMPNDWNHPEENLESSA